MTEHTASGLIDSAVVDAVLAEADRAHVKHGKFSMVNPELPVLLKLAALVEETGEVGRALTYDEGGRAKLVLELTQVASVAVSWLQSLRDDQLGTGTRGDTDRT